MDGSRFDDLSRTLANSVSRRGVLKLLLVGAMAGVRLVAGEQGAAAQAARKPPGFERLGKRCDSGQPCGIHTQCALGTCKAIKCWIGENLVDKLTTELGNPCHICQPARNWTRWSNVGDGTTCPPGDSGNSCLSSFIGTCQAGECVPDPFPDGTECGAGQQCCRGDCCSAGLPCNPVTGCGGCDIGGTPYPAGTNLANVCQVCDALANPTDWTPAPGNPPCGDDLDRVCCNGDCCPPGQCCSPAGNCEECCETGDSNRVDGTCDPEGCPTDGFGGCGENGNRFCAGGVCCDLGICPDLALDVCADYCDAVCVIGDTLYYNGDRNPANGCEQCAASTSHTSWTLVAPNYYCADTQDSVCCAGTCCAPGVGCNTNEGFVCDPDLDF